MTPSSDERKSEFGPAWLLGIPGLALALVWGVAEGSFFFIIPDLIVSLTALFSLKKSLQQMGLVVLGSILAGVVLFQWSTLDYPTAHNAVSHVPFVRDTMFIKTQHDYSTLGVNALFKGPTQGIPYKIYAIEAPPYCSLPLFLLASIPARLERLVLSWMVFALLGFGFRKWRLPVWSAFTFHGCYWVIVYICYWSAI